MCGTVKRFLSTSKVLRLALAPAKPNKGILGALFLGVEQLEWVADHTSPSRTKVNNNWSYTSSPPIQLHSVHRDFTFTLPLPRAYQDSESQIFGNGNHLPLHDAFLVTRTWLGWMCVRAYIQGVFKKRPNFLNSAPTSTESVLQLLSAPSVRFWQQTVICSVLLWALVIKIYPLNWACAQAVCRISDISLNQWF
jgi:hypothetical protein